MVLLLSLKAKLGGELDFSDTLTYELKCEDVEIRQEEKVRVVEGLVPEEMVWACPRKGEGWTRHVQISIFESFPNLPFWASWINQKENASIFSTQDIHTRYWINEPTHEGGLDIEAPLLWGWHQNLNLWVAEKSKCPPRGSSVSDGCDVRGVYSFHISRWWSGRPCAGKFTLRISIPHSTWPLYVYSLAINSLALSHCVSSSWHSPWSRPSA